MKNTEENHLGLSSKEWIERLEHEKVMEMLSLMEGVVKCAYCDYGHCDYWVINNEPSIDELKKIVERGNQEEILYLIHQYGKCLPEKGARNCGCAACRGQFLVPIYMPDVIQGMIAKRGVKAEMEAFVGYYGFATQGQEAILERGNHEEIMWYLSLHGFLPEQQKKLFARGYMDEIELHLKKHGMSDELVLEMLDNMEKDGVGKDLFYLCIQGNEFSVKCQKRMLEVVNDTEFKAYVSRYGLWEQAHLDLVLKRSVDEVRFYIAKHKYLSIDASEEFIRKFGTEDRLFFMSNSCNGIESVIVALFSLPVVDEKAFEYAFLNYNYQKFDIANKSEVDLMVMGSDSEIIEYVKKRRFLSMKAWATLFFTKRKLFIECSNTYKQMKKK